MSAIQSVAQAILDSDGGITPADIIEQTGESAQSVYTACSTLRNKMAVSRGENKLHIVSNHSLLQAIASGAPEPRANGVHHAPPPEPVPTPPAKLARDRARYAKQQAGKKAKRKAKAKLPRKQRSAKRRKRKSVASAPPPSPCRCTTEFRAHGER